jgi:dihydropteroate synthase
VTESSSQPGNIAASLLIGRRTLVMGILNLTPDSFSGDGLLGDTDMAVARAERLVAAGADVIDVGGESTRPGHEPVGAEIELARAIPLIERIAARIAIPISIDTRKAAVAEAALNAGASILNDVSGLTYDARMAEVAASSGAPIIVGHWRQRQVSDPADPLAWIADGLTESVARATRAGVKRTQLIVDPGLGFAKAPPISLEVLRRLPELRARLGLPVLIGASRKGFIGRVLDVPVDDRLEGSMATVALAVAGGADMVRVHDVGPSVRVARMADAITLGWDDTTTEAGATGTTVYLGLGANLDDRIGAITEAIKHLGSRHDIRVLRRAGLYQTAPMGVTDQPAFVNTVVEALTRLAPLDLLDRVKEIEQVLGRQQRQRWGPREIDIDILLYGDAVVDEPDLTIPHPRLWERLFALAPLADLRPDLHGPDSHPIARHLAQLGAEQRVRALGW